MMDIQEQKTGLLQRAWRWFEAFAYQMDATEDELLERRLDLLERRLAKVEGGGQES